LTNGTALLFLIGNGLVLGALISGVVNGFLVALFDRNMSGEWGIFLSILSVFCVGFAGAAFTPLGVGPTGNGFDTLSFVEHQWVSSMAPGGILHVANALNGEDLFEWSIFLGMLLIDIPFEAKFFSKLQKWER